MGAPQKRGETAALGRVGSEFGLLAAAVGPGMLVDPAHGVVVARENLAKAVADLAMCPRQAGVARLRRDALTHEEVTWRLGSITSRTVAHAIIQAASQREAPWRAAASLNVSDDGFFVDPAHDPGQPEAMRALLETL